MKPLTYILLLLFALPLTSVAQNDSIANNKEIANYNNQIDLDVQFLGVDFLYKHRIAKKLFLGVGFGGGGFLNLSLDGTYAEFIRFKMLFDYTLGKNFRIYQASTYSLLTYDSNRDNYFNTIKLGLGVFKKISIIEIGIETSIIFSEEESGRLVSSLLIVKIPLKKW